MIDIISKKGEQYTYDPATQRLFRDGVFLSRTIAEPVYSNTGKDGEPNFSGIYLVHTGEIITLTGNSKKVIDINSIK